MNVLINIDEKVYKTIKDIHNNDKSAIGTHAYMLKAIANGTPIPDNATNGQVIQTLFKPNRVERTDDDVIVENYDFSKDWWSAPYQKGGKE